MALNTDELHPFPVKSTWHHVAMDFIGPLPTTPSGNKYILTLCDYFSKWVEAIALPSKQATGVAEALYRIFMRMGLPKLLTTDQGSEFKNHLLKMLMKRLNIKHIFATAYHPQSNGLDERFNQTLQNMLSKMSHERGGQWDEFIDSSLFAYNTSVHESTHYSPFEVMFGRKAILPMDLDTDTTTCTTAMSTSDDGGFLLEKLDLLTAKRQTVLSDVKANILVAQAKQKEQYDKKHNSGPGFKTGTAVLKKDFLRKKRKGGKLDSKWLGPYTVTATLGKGYYSLQSTTDPNVIVKRVNGTHLKPYKMPKSTTQPTEVSSLSTISSDTSNYSALSDAQLSKVELPKQAETIHDSLFSTSVSPVKPVSAAESLQRTSSPIHVTYEHSMLSDFEESTQQSGFACSTLINEAGFFPTFPSSISTIEGADELNEAIEEENPETKRVFMDPGPQKDLNMVDDILESKACKRRLVFSSPEEKKQPKRKRKLLNVDQIGQDTKYVGKDNNENARCVDENITCDVQSQLLKIWQGKPCHVVKARIGTYCIHHGSLHSLKGAAFLNDEIVNTYLRLLEIIHQNCHVIISQTMTALINRVPLENRYHLLSKEQLSSRRYVVGLYNQGGIHWILIVIDLEQKLFYYLDPFGPSKSVRSVFASLIKYFRMRNEALMRRDTIDLSKHNIIQLRKRIQWDGNSCGVYCLKMAEQIIGHGFLNEKALSSMNVKKERIHVGTTLISNSVDMTNHCNMCGRADSFTNPAYTRRWVQCDGCDKWSHMICTELKEPITKTTHYLCTECNNEPKYFVH